VDCVLHLKSFVDLISSNHVWDQSSYYVSITTREPLQESYPQMYSIYLEMTQVELGQIYKKHTLSLWKNAIENVEIQDGSHFENLDEWVIRV
jgi:hypothetical protein